MSDLEKKETAYSKTIQEADTIMARLMMVIMMIMIMMIMIMMVRVEMTKRGSAFMILI